MSLAPGTRLGVYEVTAPIGEGGMGQVYRATDTKLKRQVAIKILPPSVAADADRLARFQREAEVLAALNHPNIAAIYGVEESPSTSSGQAGHTRALVMELVEGPTLQELIDAAGDHAPSGSEARPAVGVGPHGRVRKDVGLPLEEVLPIARQIADALEAAHEQGIIHRDLKPANIKVRADGTVKVLDFGLAKALGPEGASATADAMHSPTLTNRATQMGLIIGTAAYMAPEQARGRGVDRRADIWAFGVVLYEMLAGRRAFEGEDISITLANVMKDDVAWDALPKDLPAPLLRLLRRCLEKEPRKRLSAIGDARLELDDALQPPDASSMSGTGSSVAIARARQRERRAWILAVIATLTCVVALAAVWWPRESVAPLQRIQFSVETQAEPGSFSVPEISPDGRSLAFLSPARTGGANAIWVRPIDALDARALTGTEGAQNLFWSRDSRTIGYGAGGKVYRIDADGGAPQALCELPDFRSAAWTRSGGILLTAASAVGGRHLFKIPEQGGVPVEMTLTGAEGVAKSYIWPVLLPDGRRFLYLGWSLNPAERVLYVGSLDGGAPVLLMPSESMALYADPGFLLFARGGVLFAQQFDAKALKLAGEPVRVVDDVMTDRLRARPAFSVSDNGTLVYRTSGGTSSLSELAWFDRAGKVTGTVGDARNYYQVRLSPDGRRVATALGEFGSSILSVLDLGNGVSSAVTDGQANASFPAWSPDGQTLAYDDGASQRFFKQRVGSQHQELLFESPVAWKILDDWSPNGQFLLFHTLKPASLFAVPVSGPSDAKPLFNTAVDVWNARFSPDGKWIAYQITESNTPQVWVASFPAFDQRRRVSPAAGSQPVWGRNGRELFYLTATGTLMLVNVDRNTAGALDFKAPVELFQSPLTAPNPAIQQYAVSNDGQRFLFIRPRASSGAKPPITVVANWAAGLKK